MVISGTGNGFFLYVSIPIFWKGGNSVCFAQLFKTPWTTVYINIMLGEEGRLQKTNITKQKNITAAGNGTMPGDTTPKKGGRRTWRGVLGDFTVTGRDYMVRGIARRNTVCLFSLIEGLEKGA